MPWFRIKFYKAVRDRETLKAYIVKSLPQIIYTIVAAAFTYFYLLKISFGLEGNLEHMVRGANAILVVAGSSYFIFARYQNFKLKAQLAMLKRKQAVKALKRSRIESP